MDLSAWTSDPRAVNLAAGRRHETLVIRPAVGQRKLSAEVTGDLKRKTPIKNSFVCNSDEVEPVLLGLLYMKFVCI